MKNLILIFTALVFTACASNETKTEQTVEQKVEQQAKKEEAYGFPGEIAGKGYESIMNAPTLNEGQKKQLVALMDKTHGESIQLRKEMGQLKGVLFKNILTATPNKKEIDLIKKKLINLDKKKMNLMFASLDELNKILGHDRKGDYSEIYNVILKEHPEKF